MSKRKSGVKNCRNSLRCGASCISKRKSCTVSKLRSSVRQLTKSLKDFKASGAKDSSQRKQLYGELKKAQAALNKGILRDQARGGKPRRAAVDELSARRGKRTADELKHRRDSGAARANSRLPKPERDAISRDAKAALDAMKAFDRKLEEARSLLPENRGRKK